MKSIGKRMRTLIYINVAVFGGLAAFFAFTADTAAQAFTRCLAVAIAAGLLAGLVVALLAPVGACVAQLTEAAEKLARGEAWDLPTDDEGDLGRLSAVLGGIGAARLQWQADLAALTQKREAGDIDAGLDERNTPQLYQDAAAAINALIQGFNRDMAEVLDGVNKYGQGDLQARLTALPGKKARYAQSVNALGDVLRQTADEVQTAVAAHREGRAPTVAGGYRSGEWARLTNEVNKLSDAWARPTREAADALNRIAAGDMSQTVNGDYPGEWDVLKQAVNKTARAMAGYIGDITQAVTDMGAEDRGRHDYAGPFAPLRDAFRSLDGRVARLEKQAAPPPPTLARPTVANVGALPVMPTARPTAAKGSAFHAAAPVMSVARPLTAPDASHIYNSRDFGKYK